MSKVRFISLDVHAETIAVAVAETNGEVRSHGVMRNRLESIRKLIHKLGAIDEAVQQAPAEIKAVIEALQALRGIAQTTAATIVSELGSLSRFQSPRQLMPYRGLVAREHSSGNRIQRSSITKTGNAHLRRVLVEAAWAYQHRPNVTGFLLSRQKNLALSEDVKTKSMFFWTAAPTTVQGPRKGEPSSRSRRNGLWSQPARLVRGSSRRIMSMRFRPANIRVINRRASSSAVIGPAVRTEVL